MAEQDTGEAATRAKFEIYRATDARDYAEHDILEMKGMSDVIAEGLSHFKDAGGGDGQLVRLLYAAPGFSLTRVWFKSGYPLPLHSHSADCLYYILAGSLKMGTETLGPGDGFFVGEDVPYTYVPGEGGVEVLEFRNSDQLDIRFMGKSKAVWDKTAEKIKARRPNWFDEPAPTKVAALPEG